MKLYLLINNHTLLFTFWTSFPSWVYRRNSKVMNDANPASIQQSIVFFSWLYELMSWGEDAVTTISLQLRLLLTNKTALSTNLKKKSYIFNKILLNKYQSVLLLSIYSTKNCKDSSIQKNIPVLFLSIATVH